MAEIILIGQDNVQLDKSLAKEIRHKWDNNEFAPDDKIPIGEDRIKAKDIRSFRINEETPEEEDPKDLPTEQIKEILSEKNFEEKYEENRTGNFKNFNGWGTEDEGIMKWLIRWGAVKKQDGIHRVVPEEYKKFSRYHKLLSELRTRREYAEEKDEESLDQLAKEDVRSK